MKHALAAAFAALALSACASSAPAPRPDVALYALDCGRLTTTNADIFADDGAYAGVTRDMVDPCYLIRHPAGDLIWDTGLPEALAQAPGGVIENGPFRLSMPTTLSAQLTQLGLTPADIEFVSFSHSHFDHSGNGGLFAASTWIVDADERAYMFRPEARADAQSFAAYAALENANTRLIAGDADHDVFGDGSVTIIQAPGHTPGHAVLLVRLADAGPILLTGDMFHLAESRANRRVPRFNVDRAQTLASMDKIERIAAETGARVVRQHVPEDFDALPRFPEALR
ncbi:MAG: N-acyl homoserine lactonase family protein [Hyphomonadaceae bacterium]|nr:N-acyl homoserine lactonase family protein [Hyphomonadaceae bacterium]